jgi:UDP-N-acetylmuramoylalanine--D-glutamate ligase
MASYAGDKSKVWAGSVAVANADDAGVLELLAAVAPAADLVEFTLGAPAPGRFGVLDGWLADGSGQRVIPVAEIRPSGAHNVANALAAAALATAAGVDGAAIAAGLRSFTPEPHRNMMVATVSGVRYVDDSKATNPHAAAASLGSYERVVWIAGGQLKGASVDGLVADFADRMAGVVLLGADREAIHSALTRHAPNLPVIMVDRNDDRAMHDVVAAAAALATPGDVVLLAPAAASKDMFASYGARGRAFATEVAALAEGRSGT